MIKGGTILIYLVSFGVFIILQSLFINGVYDSFKGKELQNDINGKKWEGNILYPVRRFLSNYINEFYSRPVYGCVRCMSSVWGAITYFPFVIYTFGFKWVELPIYIFDVGILSYVNFYFYKKI